MASVSKISKIPVQLVTSTGDISNVTKNNIILNANKFYSLKLNLQEKVPCENFWKEKKCVIVFFRRFG